MTSPGSSPDQKPQRTVHAPSADVASGAALSVELAEDEEVQWQWSHGPDGKSQVTGYQILKKHPSI